MGITKVVQPQIRGRRETKNKSRNAVANAKDFQMPKINPPSIRLCTTIVYNHALRSRKSCQTGNRNRRFQPFRNSTHSAPLYTPYISTPTLRIPSPSYSQLAHCYLPVGKHLCVCILLRQLNFLFCNEDMWVKCSAVNTYTRHQWGNLVSECHGNRNAVEGTR